MNSRIHLFICMSVNESAILGFPAVHHFELVKALHVLIRI